MSYRPSGGMALDAQNSTTAPLAPSATFTGTATDVMAYNQVHVALKMSPNEVPDGDATTAQGSLWVQWSPDAVNWDIQIPVWVRSGIFIPQTYIVVHRYVRLVYINDGGASARTALGLADPSPVPIPTQQTAFRCSTYLLYTGTKELGRTIDQPVSGSDPVNLTRAVVMGRSIAGVYRNASVNDRGALITGDFLREVAQGNIQGYAIGTQFGRNPDVDTTSTPEDVWSAGGLYTGQPVHAAAAELVSVASSSVADTAAGTGARTVRLQGLDANFLEQSEDVTLFGLVPVTTLNTYTRVFRAWVLTAGSGATNAGTLTLRHAVTTTNIMATIPVGQAHTSLCALTVPANQTLYIVRVKVLLGRSSGAAGSADISLRVREPGGVYRAIRYTTVTTASPDHYVVLGGIRVEAQSDIVIRVEAVSDNNTICSAAFEYVTVALT